MSCEVSNLFTLSVIHRYANAYKGGKKIKQIQ